MSSTLSLAERMKALIAREPKNENELLKLLIDVKKITPEITSNHPHPRAGGWFLNRAYSLAVDFGASDHVLEALKPTSDNIFEYVENLSKQLNNTLMGMPVPWEKHLAPFIRWCRLEIERTSADVTPIQASELPATLDEQTDPVTRAIALMLAAHKEGKPINISDLPEIVGCSRATLYRDSQFKATVKALKAKKRADIPKGSKTKDGNVEAEYDPAEE